MSGIIGPVTPAKLALAAGAIGIGAITGGFIAHERDQDVLKGATIGGLIAAAGAALVLGGGAAFDKYRSAKLAAAEGVSTLGRAPTFHLPPLGASAIIAKPIVHLPTSTVAELFATSAERLHTIASTPRIPVSTLPSGTTFLDMLKKFALPALT